MIRSITLNQTHCFAPNTTMRELRKVNLLYANNGSGKTTLSNAIKNCTSGVEISWKNDEQKVYVYNRDFYRAAFTNKDNDEPGVFLLGEESPAAHLKISEAQEAKDTASKKIANIETQIIDVSDELQKHRTTAKEALWKDRAAIPSKIGKELSGFKSNKRVFLDSSIEAYEKSSNKNDPLEADYTDLSEEWEMTLTPESQYPQKVPPLPDFNFDCEIIQEVLNRTPEVGSLSCFANRAHELELDWIQQGLKLFHADADSQNCPFCQQDITSNILEELSKLFSHAYEDLSEDIKNWINLLEIDIREIANYRALTIQFNSEYNGEQYDTDALGAFERILSSTISQLKSKQQKLSQPLSFPFTDKELLDIVTHHNRVSNDLSVRREKARNKWSERKRIEKRTLERFALGNGRTTIERWIKDSRELQSRLTGLRKSRDKHLARERAFAEEIRNLQNSLKSSKHAIDGINKLLRSCQFYSFRLAPSIKIRDGYTVIRSDDSVADIESLSEGERTFLTFLYFYYQLRGVGEDGGSYSRVAVIDDPVSSLDLEVMFVVSSLIRTLIESVANGSNRNVSQVFLFTHNARFHNEISERHPDSIANEIKFFRIIKKSPEPNVISDLGSKSSVRNAYRQLWDLAAEAELCSDLNHAWLPNTLRRILETYFTELGDAKNLYTIGDTLDFEQRHFHYALTAWSHSGSHSVLDGEGFEPDSSSSFRWLEAFENIFRLAEGGIHKRHYDLMLGRARHFIGK
ncbi:AAA family ATPase [Corynebacterium falsenii]|uniref:AAA family ATPase n=1 Tax=Corynebacterium falsenii TaxID=108486 RepID=UPI0004BB62E3|nr:AAA family ATPase [Corynebacterium falsenii]UBI03758.1 AAA family ATPase [Corynebacterium falsenii]